MDAAKMLVKDFLQIIIVVFFSGCFYIGTKDAIANMQVSVSTISLRQLEMQKDDAIYKKEISERITSLELRQSITEILLKELTDKNR